MAERSSIFDMIGPVMIGPSSSHTAAVVRIGINARKLLGEEPKEVEITFYNSFARTYEGHGSDRAILGGLLGFAPDDHRIKEARKHAEEAKLKVNFRAVSNASHLHPNSIRVHLRGQTQLVQVLGISRGGGLISILEIDGFGCNFNGQSDTLVISAHDVSGSVAFLTSIIAHEDCNIATMTVSRSARNDMARLVLELDSPLRPLTLEYLRSVKWVDKVSYLPRADESWLGNPSS
ncbi:MAG: L-serine ammonia-lyase, iron-sulfur-dependent subunit beta [Bacteroidota bacterium]